MRTRPIPILISLLIVLAVSFPTTVLAGEIPLTSLHASCAAIQGVVQEMVRYLERKIAAGNQGRGPDVCRQAADTLQKTLESLRQLRKVVPSFKQSLVDEISRKVAVARFLIIADCCSQKGMETLQAADEDLSQLMDVLQK